MLTMFGRRPLQRSWVIPLTEQQTDRTTDHSFGGVKTRARHSKRHLHALVTFTRWRDQSVAFWLGDLDFGLILPQNLIVCSQHHCRSIMKVSWKFHDDNCNRFPVILLTNRQTNTRLGEVVNHCKQPRCHSEWFKPHNATTLYGHTTTAQQRTIIQQYGDWYTGRWSLRLQRTASVSEL